MKLRLHRTKEHADGPSLEAGRLRLCRGQKVALVDAPSRWSARGYIRAIVAGRSCGLWRYFQSSSCTLLSVRDVDTIVLRLQCGHSRCGRKGLAGWLHTRLGHLSF